MRSEKQKILDGLHSKPETECLYRYTNLPFLLEMLSTKKITLLSPCSWDDRNDAVYINRYREIKGIQSVLALCFTQRIENYHYWKVFAGNDSGVCIGFDKKKLLYRFSNPNILKGPVQYICIRDIDKVTLSPDELPFIKRKEYGDEGEFRIVYKSESVKCLYKGFKFDISAIREITLNPWIPASTTRILKEIIRKLYDGDVKITQTGICESRAWQSKLKTCN